MANSKQIVYLSQSQYAELIANGSIVVDDVTVTYNENDIYVTPQADPVTDVRVAGTSVTANGVANIPVVTGFDQAGAFKTNDHTFLFRNGNIIIDRPSDNYIIGGTDTTRIPSISQQHKVVFYGLAKAAGDNTQRTKDINTFTGTYTPEAKGAIQSMLGVSDLIAPAENDLVADQDYAVGDLFTANGKVYKATAEILTGAAIITTGNNVNCEETNVADAFVKDVQVNGTSIIQNGVANVPRAERQSGKYGAVAVGSPVYGIGFTAAHELMVEPAASEHIKSGNSIYRPIVASNQHEAAFYGLARAAGDTTQSQSNNAVGAYTDEAKTAIRSMLDVVSINNIVPKYDASATYAKGSFCEYEGKIYFAKVAITAAEEWNSEHWTETTLTTYASSQSQKPGLVGITPLWSGINISNEGKLLLNMPGDALIKQGTDTDRAILVAKQHIAVFYGLAKAAGDTTQSASSNTVGVYTDNAKASIKSMLGIVDGSTGTVDVSGTAPVIAAVENTRYVCGEVTTLTVTPPSSGICIVRFTSGSTPAVLTANNVVWPDWFDATELEASRVYEICITDGFGAVMSWAL